MNDVKLRITGNLASAPPSFTAVEMEIAANYSDKETMEKLVTPLNAGVSSPTRSKKPLI